MTARGVGTTSGNVEALWARSVFSPVPVRNAFEVTVERLAQSIRLGVLVGGVKRLRPEGGQLSIVCSDRNITKIFEITGLNRVFPIHADRAGALAEAGVTEAQRH